MTGSHRRWLATLALVAVWLTLNAGDSAIAGQYRHENAALLGIVTVPADKGVEINHVVAGSPAAVAGLEPGDILRRIDKSRVTKPREVDAVLRERAPGVSVELNFLRGAKLITKHAKLVTRSDFDDVLVSGRERGSIGFQAPDWYAYAWKRAGDAPPTRTSTAGKVVVIHAFQSW